MDFKDIEQALSNKAEELEQARIKELKTVSERLAILKEKEETRQREAKTAQKAAAQAALQRRIEKQAEEEQLLQEEAEMRTLEEQEYGKKQVHNSLEIERKKELERRVIEEEHNAERTRKSIEDAKFYVRRCVGNEGEIIMPNPLARFLQKEPE
jgi:hypothetical protein